jgi:hypothetical protein
MQSSFFMSKTKTSAVGCWWINYNVDALKVVLTLGYDYATYAIRVNKIYFKKKYKTQKFSFFILFNFFLNFKF